MSFSYWSNKLKSDTNIYDFFPYNLYSTYAAIIPITDFPEPVGASRTVCLVFDMAFSTICLIALS